MDVDGAAPRTPNAGTNAFGQGQSLHSMEGGCKVVFLQHPLPRILNHQDIEDISLSWYTLVMVRVTHTTASQDANPYKITVVTRSNAEIVHNVRTQHGLQYHELTARKVNAFTTPQEHRFELEGKQPFSVFPETDPDVQAVVRLLFQSERRGDSANIMQDLRMVELVHEEWSPRIREFYGPRIRVSDRDVPDAEDATLAWLRRNA
ncbi:hypothetical protein LTS18_003090 [Coniosporium uncinatum]|uniref:Uncharacterized protein n=1 Tax=Coniosporium uncinatum TaxID=93489 RepID=A0ACC3DBI6_9PEZI|nr:hypothetical protein LTS18_003090 [Coniosporium uncinatum]